MNDEYTNNKIETKASDSSSGSYVPTAEKIPAKIRVIFFISVSCLV